MTLGYCILCTIKLECITYLCLQNISFFSFLIFTSWSHETEINISQKRIMFPQSPQIQRSIRNKRNVFKSIRILNGFWKPQIHFGSQHVDPYNTYWPCRVQYALHNIWIPPSFCGMAIIFVIFRHDFYQVPGTGDSV